VFDDLAWKYFTTLCERVVSYSGESWRGYVWTRPAGPEADNFAGDSGGKMDLNFIQNSYSYYLQNYPVRRYESMVSKFSYSA